MKQVAFYVSSLCFAALMVSGCETTTTNDQAKEWSPSQRADVHAQLAAQYMERNVLPAAYEELEHALDVMPTHSRSNYVMAVLQTRLKDYDKVNYYYQRALKSNPDNSEAAHDYGIFLCSQGQEENALRYFEQALSNPLYTGRVLTNLRAGECLVESGGDLVRAETYFKTALRVNPNIPSALYHMAGINYDREKYLPARGYIERFFSVNEETPESLLLATKIELGMDAREVAEDYARKLKAKFPASEEAREVRETL